jgi:hypothetical protein
MAQVAVPVLLKFWDPPAGCAWICKVRLVQTLLYYPNVNPPRAVAWQALLYWDELATIVPPGYDFKQRLPSGALAVDALAERGL